MIVSAKKPKRRCCSRCLPLACLLLILLLVSFWTLPILFPLDEDLVVPSNNGVVETNSILQISAPPPAEKVTAGEELKSLIDARSAEIEQTKRLPGNYPPLSSLVVATHRQQQEGEDKSKVSLKVIGDVQFLLDYAIVGFSKCGTTTLLKWIRRDNNVRTFKREIHEIVNDNPGRLVERLYLNLLDNPFNTTSTASKPFLQGFKNPEILQVPMALRHVDTYWPETKLIISVRNPLKWFRSFYNFRLTIGHLKQVGTDPTALIGHCGRGNNQILCTHMGAFHVKLFRLGKTDMSSKEELDLIQPYLAPPGDDGSRDQDIWDHIHQKVSTATSIPKMKNKVFFLDLRQLSDSNRTRSKIFRRDLEKFLGLRHELTPVFRARPFKQLELTLDEESKRHKIQSICDPQYLPLQQELFPMAQKASLWIRNFFLKSPDVVVSSPDHLEELLETWMHNPCDDNQQEKEDASEIAE
ncbi:expressed unknown protein [Seminavis robusta]|uniref:Sulfotransferase domain-containing protein n=1 Tax=Seminavis robusta TaxID=568900 RepID=A0A9N8H8E2_9STRA|nr:expressed unknown protein [Seminavis robusta]|eukprot:Sro89_g046890.1 n/a (468) ;mRNA; r:46711-48114